MATERKILSDEERKLPDFNMMQRVKRRFFAMRNGDLAEQMSSRGAVYRINFGLNLPQVSEIARDVISGRLATEGDGDDAGSQVAVAPSECELSALASRLWANNSTRESMLIAPMLFPVELMTSEMAMEWVHAVPTPEIADVLCLKLLRNLLFARDLAVGFIADDKPLVRYVGLRLLLNLLQGGKIAPDEAAAMAEKAMADGQPLMRAVCTQIAEEAAFLSE